jgi:hypothetical protein
MKSSEDRVDFTSSQPTGRRGCSNQPAIDTRQPQIWKPRFKKPSIKDKHHHNSSERKTKGEVCRRGARQQRERRRTALDRIQSGERRRSPKTTAPLADLTTTTGHSTRLQREHESRRRRRWQGRRRGL